MRLPSPAILKNEYPLSEEARHFIEKSRQTATRILQGKEERLVAIVGPCSVHDKASTLEYAQRLKQFSSEVDSSLFLIMRLFIEKPRTRLGWKGMLYDPFLDGSNDIRAGLYQSRKLFLELAEMGVPCATEFLQPIVSSYFEDLVSWGLIGARTPTSQPHREIASALPFPVGFKNDVHGELDGAILGILAARVPHTYVGIDAGGHIAIRQSSGNLWTHLVLRGSEKSFNYNPESVGKALSALHTHHLHSRLLIDCSHGNSKKDHRKQHLALESVMEQVAQGNRAIAGFMLESYLSSGKQSLSEDVSSLHYGVSITDSCLGWEETERLLKFAADRSTSMSSVQK